MGCCEVHDSASPLSPKGGLKYGSILLQEKRPSRSKKKVTFDMSFIQHRRLEVTEENSNDPWYASIILNDQDEWTLYQINHSAKIAFLVQDNNLHTHTTVQLNVLVGYETIISLINNPKYRTQWDSELLKMELLFGDKNLDATVCFTYKDSPQAKIFERTVRKYKDFYVINYSPHEDKGREGYCLIVLNVSKQIEIYSKEQTNDRIQNLEKKFSWAVRLSEGITLHKKNYN